MNHRIRIFSRIGLMFALALLLAVSGGRAQAAYQFGAEDKIKKIVDLTARGAHGEALYLGYRMKVYSFLMPVYMTDDGYVIGFTDDVTRYVPLTAEKIAAFQKQGLLPTPLPAYRLTWDDWVYGYFLWVMLGGMAIVAAAVWLVVMVSRRRRTGSAESLRPLTVAALAARRNRIVMKILLVPLLVILVFAWLLHGLWLNVLRGPRDATVAEIVAAQAAGENQTWFVLAEEPQDLDVTRMITWRTQEGQVRTEVLFLYAFRGSPSILAEAERSNAQARPSLQAPVYAWIASRHSPFDSSYAQGREVAATLGHTSFAPFMLDVTNQSPNVTRALTAIGASIFAVPILLLLAGLFKAVRGLGDPLKTRNVRQLMKSVRAGEGLDRLVAEIDAQAANAQLRLKGGGTHLLPSWLIGYWATFTLMSTQDVIWIAPYTVTSHSFGVKTSERQQINVVDRLGRRLIFHVSDMNLGLRQIYSRAPWAVVGPNDEMQQAFGKGGRTLFAWMTVWRRRAKLVRRVDERRAAILSQATARQAG